MTCSGHDPAGEDKCSDDCSSDPGKDKDTKERVELLQQFSQNCRACNPSGPYQLQPNPFMGIEAHRE